MDVHLGRAGRAGATIVSLAAQPWDMVITAVAVLLIGAMVLFAAVAWSSASSKPRTGATGNYILNKPSRPI
jgi:hypothetical protein